MPGSSRRLSFALFTPFGTLVLSQFRRSASPLFGPFVLRRHRPPPAARRPPPAASAVGPRRVRWRACWHGAASPHGYDRRLRHPPLAHDLSNRLPVLDRGLVAQCADGGEDRFAKGLIVRADDPRRVRLGKARCIHDELDFGGVAVGAAPCRLKIDACARIDGLGFGVDGAVAVHRSGGGERRVGGPETAGGFPSRGTTARARASQRADGGE